MIRRPPRSTLFPYRRSSDLLRERVGSFLLDGVLGREHEKRLAQKERLSADRHLLLLHRLEQRRLDLGGGAVNLVRERQVREQRDRKKHTSELQSRLHTGCRLLL